MNGMYHSEEQYVDIRTDLWANMSVTQLQQQRDIVANKMSLLYDIITTMPAARDIYMAMTRALDDLDQLLDAKQK
jgi:hypothetical protein